VSPTAEVYLPRSDGARTSKRGHPRTYENVWRPRNKPNHNGQCLVCRRSLRKARERGKPLPPG